MLMAQTAGAWTLADLDRLPDDGNSYELIDGALFVTPAPSPAHETLVAVMHVILSPYVLSERLGLVYASRASVRTSNGHVEPDLLVRPTPERPPATWEAAPTPLLVVEVLSKSTRRRDHEQKREFYLRVGVPEYWIVDRWARTIRVIAADADDVVADAMLVWQPEGAGEALVIDVRAYFCEALGE